jgi:MFS family permease
LKRANDTLSKGLGFLVNLPRDWKITALRTSIYRFFYQMVLPYISIYTIALGATGTQLGMVNSIGMGAAGMLGPFTGWLIDRIGTKKIYLAGIGLLAISYLSFGVAQSWPIIIVAMLTYWSGFTVSIHGCSVICANSLPVAERATAMSCCETLAAGFLGMISPVIGAWLVGLFGGVNVSGIRPLFFLNLAGTLFTFFFVLTQLSGWKWGEGLSGSKPDFLKDLSQVFEQGRNLKRFLVISALTFLPQGMIVPFTHVFASQLKGADQYVLGAMVTAFAVIPFVLGIPLGRLADKIGRKKVLYLVAPLLWASNLMLIWAPNHWFLIAAGALQGFFFINTVITGAITFELVPREKMGRWLGIVRFFRMFPAAGAAYFAGVLWDNLGPQWVFLCFIGLDVLIRIPLLIGMPETLNLRNGSKDRGGR